MAYYYIIFVLFQKKNGHLEKINHDELVGRCCQEIEYFFAEICLKKKNSLVSTWKLKDMTDDHDSKDKSLEALDFIINALKEHEQHLDKLFHEIATITEQVGGTKNGLNSKVEKTEEKISQIQKEVTNLIAYILDTAPKESLPTQIKEQTGQTTPFQAFDNLPSATLQCKQWSDFKALGVNAQTLTFKYNEGMTLFQINALKGNKLIVYTGALPNFSMILKKWLSQELEINEPNILEGYSVDMRNSTL